MTKVSECLKLTNELILVLKELEQLPADAHDAKEEQITHVEGLLDQREHLLSQILPPFSSEEQVTGKKLLQMDSELVSLLADRHKDIQKDLKAAGLKKTTAARYNHPYSRVQGDGIFYDKRS